MSMRLLETGIAAIQQGKREEGARFVRIALRNDELPPAVAAVAYLWLAETTDDVVQKRAYYNDALSADPANPDARERLKALLAAQSPQPAPPASTPEATSFFQTVNPPRPGNAPEDAIVRVIGGPNGPGTAFFVTQNGLLATTRYVIGGSERITIELRNRRQVLGVVMRSWPDIDLALVQIDEGISELPPIAPYARVPDAAVLIAVPAGGQPFRGKQRPTKRVMASHWIPTDFVRLPDAGGNPLFDEQNYLAGMLTRNTSRNSGYVYGVHIATIRRRVDQYLEETGTGERRAYCPACGYLSRATGNGYFFCEICGSVAPHARHLNRYPQPDPFPEAGRATCMHCGAQAGFHNGRCLRCGQTPPAQIPS
ncbi:MAG: serine protease [Chloroflexota bacterium]|nr:MAG: hypothetical protein DIU68_00430 [Chloroflexota bacterium]